MKCPKCENEEPTEMLGCEVRGVYDGTLYWVCLKCNHAFPRDFGIPQRNEISKDYADKHNENFAELNHGEQ